MTAPGTQQPTRLDRVPQPRTAPGDRYSAVDGTRVPYRRPVSLPPEGCGHDAYVNVRTGRAGGQAVECRVCGAVGVIEP